MFLLVLRLAFAAAAASLFCGAAWGAPASLSRAPSLSGLLDLGMPLSARDAILALPPAARASSPLLPRVLMRLADSGHAEEALSLFAEVRPLLAGPIRAEAFLAAGKILWRRGDIDGAGRLFREIPASYPPGAESSLYLARILAARKDGSAGKALAAATEGPGKKLVAMEVSASLGGAQADSEDPRIHDETTEAGFAAELLRMKMRKDGAAAGLRAAADGAAGSYPRAAASLKALTVALLSDGDRSGALSAAREGISLAGKWTGSADRLPAWDGTGAGAREQWKTFAALYPLDADAGRFLSAGRKLLAAAELLETLAAAENGTRDLSRRAILVRGELRARSQEISRMTEHVEAIRQRYMADRKAAAGVRDRLRKAAEELPLSAWGERADRSASALLGLVDGEIRAQRERLARVKSALSAATAAEERRRSLSLDDRKMLFFLLERASRTETRLAGLEGKAAFLKARIWNRWKEEYASRAGALLSKAEAAVPAAATGAARAERDLPPLLAARDGIATWIVATERIERIAAREAATLARRKADARAAAENTLALARADLLAATARQGRAMSYLAARAATEWRIEGKASPADNMVLSPARRNSLLAEALLHWEASRPPAGEPGEVEDEALYALGELRYEEAESRFIEREKTGKGHPDYTAAATLFRSLIERFPGSPYIEPAQYGLALCMQESGDMEGAAATLAALLGRNPGTRYADEIHLRLGEHAFDRYEFPAAEGEYRKVSPGAPPEMRATAAFKLGWSIFLQGRPAEAAEPFLSALLLSPSARRTGGVRDESLRMVARSLVEAGKDGTTEAFLAERGGAEHGPAILIRTQEILSAQNRYEDAARVADRIGAAYPVSAARLDAEAAAADSLRKARKEEESQARRGRFHEVFGPGTRWQSAPGRTAGEIARANEVSEEGLRVSAFFFHARSREAPPGDRPSVLRSYEAYLRLFPGSPKAGEVAYQRAWLLFEDGRKGEAGAAFEAVAPGVGPQREEMARYMAIQCAKDLSSPSDRASQERVVRLCLQYESAIGGRERIRLVLLDRARAHFNMKDFSRAASAADAAAAIDASPPERRTALRLAGDARFEAGDFPGAEKAFRKALVAGPDAPERREIEKWVGFSLFRQAEAAEKDSPAKAADLFMRLAVEFPALESAPVSRFRAGKAYADGGRPAEAIGAFLSLEGGEGGASLALDATRSLAPLYERKGEHIEAAIRYERIAGLGETTPANREKLLLRAADLYAKGKDEARFRKILLAVVSLPATSPGLAMRSIFRIAESLRLEGKVGEADERYEQVAKAHKDAPGAAPAIAGRAFFERAEIRFATYRGIRILPPFEKTFPKKQASLEECAALYLEGIRVGEAETVAASLHRLGEAFEDFRTAVLSSPPPPGLSEREREEYGFLLEEKAAPIEEKAVEAYLRNLRQAVAADSRSPWVEKSVARLAAMRPARFAKKWEYSFPVLAVPDFHGVVERVSP